MSEAGFQSDPCSMLPKLRTALYSLMAGSATAMVRDADRMLQYHPGNVSQLRLEITKLEHMCGFDPVNNPGGMRNPHARARRAGPFSTVPTGVGRQHPYY